MSSPTTTLSVIMPEGPGQVNIELFGRWEGTINDTPYPESPHAGRGDRVKRRNSAEG